MAPRLFGLLATAQVRFDASQCSGLVAQDSILVAQGLARTVRVAVAAFDRPIAGHVKRNSMPRKFADFQVAVELVAFVHVLVRLACEPLACFAATQLHSCPKCSFAQALRLYRESFPLVLLEVVVAALRVQSVCFSPALTAIEHRVHVSVR